MIEFTIKSTRGVEATFKKLEHQLAKTDPMLAQAGMYMLGSIDKNFRAQGRPSKWQGLSPMTKAFRRKGKGGGSAKFAILQDTGRLKGSISAKVYARTTANAVTVGTNIEYAPLMHFGGMTKGKTFNIKSHKRRITQAWGKPISPRTVTVKAHPMKIGPKKVPARPFILFQREDIQAIEKLGLKFMREAINKK